MEMLLLGDMISADKALELGLVNRAVQDGEALDAAIALGEAIAGKSPLTLATGKKAFYTQAEMSLADAYHYTAQVMVENMLFRDAEEGIMHSSKNVLPNGAVLSPAFASPAASR